MRTFIVRYGLAALCVVISGSFFDALLGQPGKETPKTASEASNSSSRIRLTAAPSTELRVDAHMEPIKDSTHGFHSKWKELAEFKPAMLVDGVISAAWSVDTSSENKPKNSSIAVLQAAEAFRPFTPCARVPASSCHRSSRIGGPSKSRIPRVPAA